MFCVDDCVGLCAFWLMGWLTALLYGVQWEVDIRLLADPSYVQISRRPSFHNIFRPELLASSISERKVATISP